MSRAKEQENKIKLDLSGYPKDEKNNAIVPDPFFDDHYKELPNGTRSESGKVAYNGGILNVLGSNPEKDREVHKKGGEALQAKIRQRRTFAETIDLMLRERASKEIIAALGLPEDATNQDAGIAAMMRAMASGDTKAANFLRDTVGEKPVDRQEIDANIMTDADKALLEKVNKRLENE